MQGYSRTFYWSLWLVLAVLTVSGVLLAPGVFELRMEWAVPVGLPDGWRVGTAALHAAGAIATTALFGMLLPIHVMTGWRRRRQVITGILLLAGFTMLACTGLGVNYLGDETLGLVSSLMHLGVALLLALLLGVHAVRGRAMRIERADRT